MFAGHLGAALLIGRAERRVNVGTLIAAALLLDILLWLLILLGWESVVIPADFKATHQPEFVFPCSHGLLASIGWSSLVGIVVYRWHPGLNERRLRAAVLVGVAVFSHWVLDVLVHVPELPVAGANSLKLGLGLWQNMPVALAIEAVIVVAGLCLYLPGAVMPRARKFWLAVLSLLVLAMTIAGMTIAPPPPSTTAMAASSLAAILVVCGLTSWLGRVPSERHPDIS